jgi:hypothetical protein
VPTRGIPRRAAERDEPRREQRDEHSRDRGRGAGLCARSEAEREQRWSAIDDERDRSGQHVDECQTLRFLDRDRADGEQNRGGDRQRNSDRDETYDQQRSADRCLAHFESPHPLSDGTKCAESAPSYSNVGRLRAWHADCISTV